MYPCMLLYTIFYLLEFLFKFFFSLGQFLVAEFSDLPVDRPLTPVDRLCLRRKILYFFVLPVDCCYRTSRPIKMRDSLYLFGRPVPQSQSTDSRILAYIWSSSSLFRSFSPFSHSDRRSPFSPKISQLSIRSPDLKFLQNPFQTPHS